MYYLTFGMVLGQVLFPVWFFQGMERMKYITFLNILSKLVFTFAIFVFVKHSSDYMYVPFLSSLGFIIAGILSLWIIFKDFEINFKTPDLKEIKYQLKEGWYIFTTSIQSNILSSSGVFVLGLFETKVIVGYYAAVEKLLKAFVLLFSPITQSLYPYSSYNLNQDVSKGKKFLFKVGSFIMFFAFIVSVFLFIFSEDLLKIVFTVEYIKYAVIIKILSIWLLFGVLNNLIGIQFLLGMGYNSIYFKSFSFAAFTTLFIYFSLTPLISFYGIITGMVIGELTLTLNMVYFIKKYKL